MGRLCGGEESDAGHKGTCFMWLSEALDGLELMAVVCGPAVRYGRDFRTAHHTREDGDGYNLGQISDDKDGETGTRVACRVWGVCLPQYDYCRNHHVCSPWTESPCSLAVLSIDSGSTDLTTEGHSNSHPHALWQGCSQAKCPSSGLVKARRPAKR